MLRRILIASAASLVGGSLFLAGAAPAPPGPGQVLEMHRRLFEALDRGDVKAVGEFLTVHRTGADWSPSRSWTEPQGFLAYGVDLAGTPHTSGSPKEGLKRLMSWAAEGARKDSRWKTEITKAWSDCSSRDMSFLCMEFERRRPSGDGVETVKYRSTSLVSHRDGHWVIWHLHVSKA